IIFGGGAHHMYHTQTFRTNDRLRRRSVGARRRKSYLILLLLLLLFLVVLVESQKFSAIVSRHRSRRTSKHQFHLHSIQTPLFGSLHLASISIRQGVLFE